MIFLHSYILYDINPPEGFNLRRDVYVRLAVFLKRLIERDKEYQWQLVLPPWGNFYENERLCFTEFIIFIIMYFFNFDLGNLYHWHHQNTEFQKYIFWSNFFDITNLQRYIPVIEMYKFMEGINFIFFIRNI